MIDQYRHFREQYGVPAHRGCRITFDGKPGVIVGVRGPYLRLRLDGQKRIVSAHPTWMMEYAPEAYERTRVPKKSGGGGMSNEKPTLKAQRNAIADLRDLIPEGDPDDDALRATLDAAVLTIARAEKLEAENARLRAAAERVIVLLESYKAYEHDAAGILEKALRAPTE